jgi:wyosine [tRNA(Phe)-imidazoG37] synthetase (radical SAM superfamily)
MKAVYGPVSSWRLGRSLGIDPICSDKKICSFDCVYCQLSSGEKSYERKEFIPLEKLKEDLKLIEGVEADVITFSGTGEPTMAKNLKEMIDYVRTVSDLPLAILTNSSLLAEKDVRDALYKLDIVAAKLDAPNEMLFKAINRPYKDIEFDKYLKSIKTFREDYCGKFALQMMFIEKNKAYANEMVDIARELEPDQVQINTPDPEPYTVKPLSEEEIKEIRKSFDGFKDVIYEKKRPEVKPIDEEEVRKRRPRP